MRTEGPLIQRDDHLSALRRPHLSIPLQGLAAAWVLGMLVLGSTRPYLYEALLQEDHWVEWWTVTLFAAAGVLALRLAWLERRPFDGLVGAFCIFVAGEEFSWGQRLLGLTPPETFLEHNRQQELNIHNFADVFGEPKWVLMMALVGFGVIIPLTALLRPGRQLLAKLGATAVRLPASAWVILAVTILWWYPLTLTGEWVEALAGGLFLTTYAGTAVSAGLAAAGGVVVAGLLTWVSGVAAPSPLELACARVETAAIAEDLAYGAGATGRLAGSTSVHKRVFTAMDEGYVRWEGLEQFRATECGAEVENGERRQFAIDPWGKAYWLHMERTEGRIRLVAYSFGPNRRRDGPPGTDAGDDIESVIVIEL